MGEVWRAHDSRLGRQVALKRVRTDRRASFLEREHLRREARAAARLSHPAVVQLYDLLETPEGDWLVLEYVEGPSLAELLRRGPLPVETVCRLGCQVAEGLAQAHARGLVHRDLKAENVMMTRAGTGATQAKILDFGLARSLLEEETAATAGGVVAGTFRAMAPEQARGEAVGPVADLFALGVLLYEMSTGRSPFAGKSAAHTLHRVTHEVPPPARALRPQIPPALDTLIAGLLQKDPTHRPADAAEVARALARIADLPAPARDHHAVALPDPLAATAETLPAPLRRPRAARRARWTAGVAAGLVLCALGTLGGFARGALSPDPRRVAVLPPEVIAGDAQGSGGELLALVVAAVEGAVTRELLGLEGVAAVDPEQIGELRGSAVQVGRAVAAQEVVASQVAAHGGFARVTLTRIVTEDGRVLWSDTFQVPTAPQDALVLAGAVGAHLRSGYPHRRRRPGVPDLAVRPEDYRAFLDAKRRVEGGQAPWEPELERLEQVIAGSPRFVEAYLLALSLARDRFTDTGDRRYLARAERLLEGARRIDPADLRLAHAAVVLALTAGDEPRAERLLAELEELDPGDPQILAHRSRLAQRRGDLDGAIAAAADLVERRGTWRDLYRLANLELKRGLHDRARAHLERLLSLVPDHGWGLGKLAELELLYGDPRRAEELGLRLLAAGPQRSDLTNLGLARFLQGRYAEAAATYRQALALEPGHLAVLLNLADAELALGRPEAATRRYREALDRLDARDPAALSSVEEMIRAQCLARLGETGTAVEVTLRALKRDPQNPEVAYLAALVFSLAGQDSAARASAREALALGVQPRWFTFPGFEPLRASGVLPPLPEA
jgi:serine/threonine-protein kinase